MWEATCIYRERPEMGAPFSRGFGCFFDLFCCLCSCVVVLFKLLYFCVIEYYFLHLIYEVWTPMTSDNPFPSLYPNLISQKHCISTNVAKWGPHFGAFWIYMYVCMYIYIYTENKMKPTNPNADTYVEEQKQYLFIAFQSGPSCGTPWHDSLRWHSWNVGHPSYLTLL